MKKDCYLDHYGLAVAILLLYFTATKRFRHSFIFIFFTAAACEPVRISSAQKPTMYMFLLHDPGYNRYLKSLMTQQVFSVYWPLTTVNILCGP